MESVVLLQSYLIKMTRITTNTIVTMTALIPPAIGPIFGGSDVGSFTTINIKYIFKARVSVMYCNLNMLYYKSQHLP